MDRPEIGDMTAMTDVRLTEPDHEAVEQLEAAITKLRKDGWGRGKFHNVKTGCRDALGALGAPFGPNDWPAAATYLAHAIRERAGADTKNMRDLSDAMVILRFNDGFKRKFEEVETMFEAAIRCANGEGVHVRG